MEFDKSRVYTTLNAEDLPIGSKCIFADDLNSLREKVQEAEFHVSKLTAVEQDCELYRFDDTDDAYALAYLVELPKKPKHKPFSSKAIALEVINKHGGWLKPNEREEQYLLTGIHNRGIYLGNSLYYPFEILVKSCVFADDGTPVGEKVEDTVPEDQHADK